MDCFVTSFLAMTAFGGFAGRRCVFGSEGVSPSVVGLWEDGSMTVVEAGWLDSPPLEGCPKGGVVGGFAHEEWHFVFLTKTTPSAFGGHPSGGGEFKVEAGKNREGKSHPGLSRF
jgi:hypothetical protein